MHLHPIVLPTPHPGNSRRPPLLGSARATLRSGMAPSALTGCGSESAETEAVPSCEPEAWREAADAGSAPAFGAEAPAMST